MEVGTALRAKVGELVCGDLPVVARAQQRTVMALIDGLGHGPHALEAAEHAAAVVRRCAADLLPGEILKQCHKALAGTRGAAITVICVEHTTLELIHAGVGNVQLYAATQGAVHPIPVPGVVGGASFRKVLETRFQLHRGDIVVMASDGVSSHLEPASYRHLDAQAAADAILRDLAKDHDDASCAVLRV